MTLMLTACSGNWNDLVHGEVVAEITAFGIEGQVSSVISKARRTVTVTMPAGSKLDSLILRAFSYTEGAKADKDLAVGAALDLTSPVEIVLTTYDSYTWTITAVLGQKEEDYGNNPVEEFTKDGPQLYNMSFDHWSKNKDNDSIDVPCAEDATEEQKSVWGSGGDKVAALGFPTVLAEKEFLAVSGEGKAALKLQTQKLLGKLASGSVFTGKMGRIDFFSMSAKLEWGIPFTSRPVALEGYACYKPAEIDTAENPYKDKIGETDNGHIFILLTDWEKPFVVNPPSSLVDFDGDPAIIGYGKVVFDKEMGGYEHFQADIEYRNDRTPKLITIVAASSALGDYFTGGTGSVLYVDEMALLYKQ